MKIGAKGDGNKNANDKSKYCFHNSNIGRKMNKCNSGKKHAMTGVNWKR